jgi:four helix bundle protein
MGDFRKLQAWQRAHTLVIAVYQLTERLPGSERFGLTAQMRRAALSIPSNLAEGCGRRAGSELRRFIRISQGSLAELECQMMLARDLGLVGTPEISAALEEIHAIRGMLEHLYTALEARRKRQTSRPSTSDRTLDP